MSETAQGDVSSSIRWSVYGTIAAGVFQFAIMAVLARLLTPADYGGYALGMVIVGMSAIFVTNVITRTLVVTEPEAGERDDTLAIALFCMLAGLAAVAVYAGISRFLSGKIDIALLLTLVGSVCIACFSIMPIANLRRQLRFGPIVVAELSGLVIGQGVAAVGLAMAGWGAYALAAGACVQSGVMALIARSRMPGPPFALPTLHHSARLLRQSAALGGNAATEVLNGQIAPLALGAGLGVAALGLFNRASSLVQMPIQLLVSSANRVMVSALFSVSNERDRLRSASRALATVAGVLAAPVAAGIAGASHNFVMFALGREWIAAETIMPLIALAAWAMLMGTLLAIIAEAMRAFASKIRTQLVSSFFLAAFVLAGMAEGLVGAVAGIALGSCLFFLLYARLASRLLELPVFSVLGWFLPGLVIAAPCFVASLTIGLAWTGSPGLVLAAQIVACGMIEAAALLVWYPALALQIVEGGAPGVLRAIPKLERRLRSAAQRREA